MMLIVKSQTVLFISVCDCNAVYSFPLTSIFTLPTSSEMKNQESTRVSSLKPTSIPERVFTESNLTELIIFEHSFIWQQKNSYCGHMLNWTSCVSGSLEVAVTDLFCAAQFGGGKLYTNMQCASLSSFQSIFVPFKHKITPIYDVELKLLKTE